MSIKFSFRMYLCLAVSDTWGHCMGQVGGAWIATGIKGHLDDSLFLTQTVIVSFSRCTLSSQPRTPLRTGKSYHTYNTAPAILQISPISLFSIVSRFSPWKIEEEEGVMEEEEAIAEAEEDGIVDEVEEAGVKEAGVPWAL